MSNTHEIVEYRKGRAEKRRGKRLGESRKRRVRDEVPRKTEKVRDSRLEAG